MTTDLSKQRWYDVPPNARPSECREATCRATIYWTVTENDRKVPVDCEVDGGYEPTAREHGRGVSHFATCTAPKKFSGQSRAANAPPPRAPAAPPPAPPPADDVFDPGVPFRATFKDGDEYQRARVERTVDGDTVRVVLDLGHDVTVRTALRIAGLYCAERFSGAPDERARGEAAWRDAARLLPAGVTVYVRTEKTASGTARETLGRLVAHVRFRQDDLWMDFADVMRGLGHDGQGKGSAVP